MMVMKMDEGLDTGPVAMTARVAIEPDMTGGELHDRLAATGAALMAEAMSRLERGDLPLTAQPADGVVYAKKIDKAEARIDWSQPARAVHDAIRALSPFPGAWCEISVNGKAERLKVLRSTLADGSGPPGTVMDDRLAVACGNGAVRLVEVQRAGGRPMSAEEFLRGVRVAKGDRLT
jgi:methionyl-tRNA formyltransferase